MVEYRIQHGEERRISGDCKNADLSKIIKPSLPGHKRQPDQRQKQEKIGFDCIDEHGEVMLLEDGLLQMIQIDALNIWLAPKGIKKGVR